MSEVKFSDETITYGGIQKTEWRWKQVNTGVVVRCLKPTFPRRYTRRKRKEAMAKWLKSPKGNSYQTLKILEQKIKATKQRMITRLWNVGND